MIHVMVDVIRWRVQPCGRERLYSQLAPLKNFCVPDAAGGRAEVAAVAVDQSSPVWEQVVAIDVEIARLWRRSNVTEDEFVMVMDRVQIDRLLEERLVLTEGAGWTECSSGG